MIRKFSLKSGQQEPPARFRKGPKPLLCAASWDERVKITKGGVPNCLNYFLIFHTIHIFEYRTYNKKKKGSLDWSHLA
jgi:hypothetical protein